MENLGTESTLLLLHALLEWAKEEAKRAREEGARHARNHSFKVADVMAGKAGAFDAMQIHLREVIEAYAGGAVLSISKLEPGELDPRD